MYYESDQKRIIFTIEEDMNITARFMKELDEESNLFNDWVREDYWNIYIFDLPIHTYNYDNMSERALSFVYDVTKSNDLCFKK